MKIQIDNKFIDCITESSDTESLKLKINQRLSDVEFEYIKEWHSKATSGKYLAAEYKKTLRYKDDFDRGVFLGCLPKIDTSGDIYIYFDSYKIFVNNNINRTVKRLLSASSLGINFDYGNGHRYINFSEDEVTERETMFQKLKAASITPAFKVYGNIIDCLNYVDFLLEKMGKP